MQVIANAGAYNDKGALAEVDLGEFEELFKINVSLSRQLGSTSASREVEGPQDRPAGGTH